MKNKSYNRLLLRKEEVQLTEIILVVGVVLYFLVRIWLAVKYGSVRLLAKNGKLSKGALIFSGVDLIIFTVVIFQLTFFKFGKMNLGHLSEEVRMLGIFLFIMGVLLSNWGRIILGKNWKPAMVSSKLYPGQELVTTAPFSVIRHPIYGGMILMGFGFELSLLNWFFLAIIPLSFLLYWQAKSEEKILEASFLQYKQYRIVTKMFLPGIF